MVNSSAVNAAWLPVMEVSLAAARRRTSLRDGVDTMHAPVCAKRTRDVWRTRADPRPGRGRRLGGARISYRNADRIGGRRLPANDAHLAKPRRSRGAAL